jgi:hypothetical protein
MNITPLWRAAIRLSPLAALLALGGCSNPREDVRVTLCKDMISTQLRAAEGLEWRAVETSTRGREYAVVQVHFSGPRGDGEASCYYDYDAVDDTALTLSDPLSAYSTSPSKMTLNGQTLSRPVLARAVKEAMLKQGKGLVDEVKRRLAP